MITEGNLGHQNKEGTTGWVNIIDNIDKAFYRFDTNPIKILMTFFIELEQTILKFAWKHNRC